MQSHAIRTYLNGTCGTFFARINEIASYGDVPRAAVIYMAAPKINTISAGSRIQMRTGMDSKKCAGKILL